MRGAYLAKCALVLALLRWNAGQLLHPLQQFRDYNIQYNVPRKVFMCIADHEQKVETQVSRCQRKQGPSSIGVQ